MAQLMESRQLRQKNGNLLKDKRLDLVLQALASLSSEVSLTQLQDILGTPSPTRRTLQRLLAHLVDEDKVIAIGQARGRKYKLKPENLDQLKRTSSRLNVSCIPFSNEALRVRKAISNSIEKRPKVTYNIKFLDEYTPNSTFYLSDCEREKLMESGNSLGVEKPVGTYAKQIFNRLLIDLSWNSSRLEGNTYSLLETEKLLCFNEPTAGKNLEETQMILNHKAAIEFLVGSAESIKINNFTIQNLHALLSNNLLADPGACGRIRRIPVRVSGTTYTPLAIPQLLEENFKKALKKAEAIKDPLEQAFFLMVHLPYLQAFEDVNKRVSRLAANISLIRANLSPLSFVDVPEADYISGLLGVYELNEVSLLRDIFIWAYKRSCLLYSGARKILGEPDPFRMTHRELIGSIIKKIVLSKMDKTKAHQLVEEASLTLDLKDQKKLVEVVETELLGLHEGNIVRYHLTLNSYRQWQSKWI